MNVRILEKNIVDHSEVQMRILFISNIFADLKTTSEFIERVAIEASAQNADIVLYGGGFVRGSHEAVTSLEPLTRIRAHLGRYFVLGDSDYLDDPARVRSFFQTRHIQDLTNAHVTIVKHGRALRLTGIDDAESGAPVVVQKEQTDFPHVVFSQKLENIVGEEPEMRVVSQSASFFRRPLLMTRIELGI